jgi:8-oxo-dGTP pyrophosphatase MutT (NUDIX family)
MSRIAVIMIRHPDFPNLILHGKRKDNGKWCTPAGGVHDHETFSEGAKRELFEETGIKANRDDLINLKNGVYNDHEIALFEYKSEEVVAIDLTKDPDGEFSEIKYLDPRGEKDLYVDPQENIVVQYLYGDLNKSEGHHDILANKFIEAAKIHHDVYKKTNDPYHFDKMNHYLGNATKALKTQHGDRAMNVVAKKAKAQGIEHMSISFDKKELDPSLGIKLMYNKPAGSGPYSLHSVHAYAPHPKTGKMVQVGSLSAEQQDGSFMPDMVHVEPTHRRKGIATAMYNHMAQQTGLNYQPDLEHQSKEGKTFSQAYRSRLGKSEDLNKMSRPTLKFPKLEGKVPTRHDQEVQVLTNDRQKKLFGAKVGQAYYPDKKDVPHHNYTQTQDGQLIAKPTEYKTLSQQPTRARQAKATAGRFGRSVFGTSYDVSKESGKFKTLNAAIGGKLRTKFEGIEDPTHDAKLKEHGEKSLQHIEKWRSDIDAWRKEGQRLYDTGATVEQRIAHNDARPKYKKLRKPSLRAKDTSKLTPEQQAVRGKATEQTIQHEAAHSLFREIEHKHGPQFLDRVQTHLLDSFPESTRAALKQSALKMGYKSSGRHFKEELINHARDILVNPLKRETFKKLLGGIGDEHIKHLKRGWQEIINRAKSVGGDFGKAEWKDKISGGLADNKKPEDFDPKQLAAGKEVESEHTSDPHMAQEIAQDHLTEDKNYYLKLKTIEKSNSIKPFGQNIYDSAANIGRKMGRTGDTVEGAGPNTAVQQSSKSLYGSMKQQVDQQDKMNRKMNRKQPVKQLSAADASAYFQKLLSTGRIKKA